MTNCVSNINCSKKKTQQEKRRNNFNIQRKAIINFIAKKASKLNWSACGNWKREQKRGAIYLQDDMNFPFRLIERIRKHPTKVSAIYFDGFSHKFCYTWVFVVVLVRLFSVDEKWLNSQSRIFSLNLLLLFFFFFLLLLYFDFLALQRTSAQWTRRFANDVLIEFRFEKKNKI